MTTLSESSSKCAACGAEIAHTVVMSTNTLGSPDLDLRPAEMQRSTMEFWVVECPECQCVQMEDEREKFDLDFIRSGEYRALIHALLPKMANRYNRLAVLMLHMGALWDCDDHGYSEDTYVFRKRAAEAYRYAAWDCDDHGYEKEAVLFRERAADLYLGGRFTAEIESPTDSVICVDLLRRSGQFYRAIEIADATLKRYEVATLDREQAIMKAVLIFQKAKCEANNTDCYTVGDVPGIDDVPVEPDSDEIIFGADDGDTDEENTPWGKDGEFSDEKPPF